jgi:SAM-dependent methyltransferase
MPLHNWLICGINRRIARALPYQGRVVDLGCGTAPYKAEILRVADEYIGVDWEHSVHGTSCVDVVADLCTRLPFDDEYADTVVSFQVLEHLREPEFFLSECHRILKKDGRLFLTVPFMWHIHEAPHDYYRFTRHGLEYLLGKTRFGAITITENSGFWQMWVLKFNYHVNRVAPGPLKLLWAPVWACGQMLAPILDRYDKATGECVSYTVTASKAVRP